MGRSLIWIEDDQGKGWSCSYCRWSFPVPTLLSDPEAKSAYDRLAAGRFRDHTCEAVAAIAEHGPARTPELTLADRVKALVTRGYKPKDAVEIVLDELGLECRNDPDKMTKARTEADDFLEQMRKGLI
jgi:hypothetical protein